MVKKSTLKKSTSKESTDLFKPSVLNTNQNANQSTIESIFQNSEEREDPQAKIIHELISEEDLERKTELTKPLKWSALEVIRDKILSLHLDNSSEILLLFIDKSFKFLISKDRKSRAELVEALKSLNMKVETSVSDESKIRNMIK